MIALLSVLFLVLHVEIPSVHAFSISSEALRPSCSRHRQIHNMWRLRCNIDLLLQDLVLERCCHPFDQTIHNFYSSNFHKKRNKKHVPSLPKADEDCSNDAIYVLKSSQGMVLAALRLTRSKNDSDYIFLRSLCVSRDYRRHGLALRLVDESLDDCASSNSYCYCFASPYLEDLYHRAGFLRIPKSNMNPWPKWLVHSYNSMDARWSRKTLGLFIKPPSSESNSNHDNNTTQIVLIQHSLEFSKKTATGWLLDDKLYYKHAATTTSGMSMQLSRHLKIQRWVWNGRNDTSRVEDQIQSLLGSSSSRVYLLWTGGSDITLEHDKTAPDDESETPATFIILDGTWQQAKTLFRKIPALWQLPSVSLSDVPPSTFILRGDYSGWKERFSAAAAASNRDGPALLCTAEVAAAILDRQGDEIGANLIRRRLAEFQTAFLQQRNGLVETSQKEKSRPALIHGSNNTVFEAVYDDE
jgi:DTW domain-containing protein YfiP/N-acetylglutamate synthase-like GNAT family acetyltransferase